MDQLNSSLEQLFGVGDMTPEEREDFFASVGDTILNATFLRFTTELSERERQALEQYLESIENPQLAFQHILEHYPLFGNILEEETRILRNDATTILDAH